MTQIFQSPNPAVQQALVTYERARKQLDRLGKTSTTTEWETAMAAVRSAELSLRGALLMERSCEA